MNTTNDVNTLGDGTKNGNGRKVKGSKSGVDERCLPS